MHALKRTSARLTVVPLTLCALIAFAAPAPAAAPTSYGVTQAARLLPLTSVDLEYSPGPSAGGGSGRRVH